MEDRRSRLLGFFDTVAGKVHLQDHAMMDHPVYHGNRGHGILEDLLPLRKHEIAGDDDRSSLVSVGQ